MDHGGAIVIRTAQASATTGHRPAINTLRGEFDAMIAGELCRFDTRLSTIAAIEEACGGRAIVEVLNGIILGRRAKDQIPLIAAALKAADPWRDDPEALAAEATVGEAEAFVLALVFALGFTVGSGPREGRDDDPLDRASDGGAGGNSRSGA